MDHCGVVLGAHFCFVLPDCSARPINSAKEPRQATIGVRITSADKPSLLGEFATLNQQQQAAHVGRMFPPQMAACGRSEAYLAAGSVMRLALDENEGDDRLCRRLFV